MTNSGIHPLAVQPDPGGVGLPSLGGYFYQIDVSVLSAIDTLLLKKLTDKLVLEPAGRDDLEADLKHPQAMSAAADISAANYRLIVQAKYTTGGPWKQGAFIALLKHGAKRESALTRLKNETVRYLLATNTAVDQSLNTFRVNNIGEWPTKFVQGAKLKLTLPGSDSRRVAILSLDEEKIAFRLRDFLEGNFHVPRALLNDCIKALRQDALDRMRGVADGVWSRADLEAVIRKHEGYFASSVDIELFVRPENWSEIQKVLADNKAVILAGRSGTGKTLTAKVLADRLRKSVPGLTVKHVTQGPNQISTDMTTDPVAYHIEDPWGKYRFDPKSEPWNDELGRFLLSARNDRYFIITSRSDVLVESRAKLGAKWFVTLEAEDYSAATRARILSKRLATLPRRLQNMAVPRLGDAVDALELPLEIQRYIENLVNGPAEGELEHVFVSRCIGEAHRETLDDIVAQQVRQRDAHAWAATIWGVLKGAPILNRSVFTELQRLIGDRFPQLDDGLERFINFLVSGQSIRQNETAVSYYHPRVEAGLEKAMLEKAAASSRILAEVANSLLVLDEDAGTDWGVEIVAKMVQAASSLEGMTPIRLAAKTRGVLDEWLVSKLRVGSKNYLNTIRLGADALSPKSLVRQFCSWLLARDSKRHMGFPLRWVPDRDDDEWYDRLAKDADVRVISHHFVRYALPYDSETYPSNISARLARVAADIPIAFIAAASDTVGAGFFWNADALAQGASLDLARFWPVVNEALDYLRQVAETPDDGQTLQIYNGEFSEDYEEHLREQAGEDGYAACEFVEHYVAKYRKRHGWKALSTHERIAELGSAWIKAVRDDDADGVAAEFEFLATFAAEKEFESEFWHVADGCWMPLLSPYLVKALARSTSDNWLRKYLLTCALRWAPEAIPEAIADVAPARFLELLVDLGHAKDEFKVAAAAVRAQMAKEAGGAIHPVADAFSRQDFDRPLDASAATLLQTMDVPEDTTFRLRRARLLFASGRDVRALINELLTEERDSWDSRIKNAALAIDLAASAGYQDIVNISLKHRYADVRQHAMNAIAATTSDKLPDVVLALATDPGSRVKQALLSLIEARLGPETVPALVNMTKDRWTPHSRYYGDTSSFEIAGKAAKLLGSISPLPPSTVKELLDTAQNSEDESLAEELYFVVAQNGSAADQTTVVAFALSRGKVRPHLAAVKALLRVSSIHRPSDLAPANVKELVERAPQVAAALAVLVGLRGEETHVLSVAAGLSASKTRGAMLFPLYVGASTRPDKLATKVTTYFPATIAKQLDKFDDEHPIPRDFFDAIGDVASMSGVHAVLPWCFEKPKDK